MTAKSFFCSQFESRKKPGRKLGRAPSATVRSGQSIERWQIRQERVSAWSSVGKVDEVLAGGGRFTAVGVIFQRKKRHVNNFFACSGVKLVKKQEICEDGRREDCGRTTGTFRHQSGTTLSSDRNQIVIRLQTERLYTT